MAQMSRCSICKNFNFKAGKCIYYADEIPKDIFIELTPCEKFCIEKDDGIDEDLPIAKGR